jgi:hypothetical protein
MSRLHTEEPEPRPDRRTDDDEREGNELGYRNVDEDAEHDERGSQGPGPGDREPGER